MTAATMTNPLERYMKRCPKCDRPWAEYSETGWYLCTEDRWFKPDDLIRLSRVYMANSLGGNGGHLNLNPAALQTVRVSDVAREDVTFRWSNRLAVGKLHIVEGDPGTGKSYLSAAITTAYTKGLPLPGDEGMFVPQDVLIFTAEDGIADTVRPRLEDMGADLSRVAVVTAAIDAEGVEHFPNLAEDLLLIEAELSKGTYGGVILDPLNAYLKGVNGDRDIDLRSVLGPLAQLAERMNVTIICIRHLTKSSRDRAIYRGQGNIAYVAAARIVLLVGLNPDDKSERIVVGTKNNLSPLGDPVAFEIAGGQFRWKGVSDVTAEQLLAPDTPPEDRNAREESIEFLTEALSDGPRLAAEIFREARALGIADKTLRRAKDDLGVKSEPYYEEGKRGAKGWRWVLHSGGQNGLDGHDFSRGKHGHLNGSQIQNGSKAEEVGHLNTEVTT